ncbi:MAG: PEP-CTERM sorting domain-containing protein [Opitutales bacterium]|nr:PEP-CTERM sorting domain-containing protein [Opitutales bacterium]
MKNQKRFALIAAAAVGLTSFVHSQIVVAGYNMDALSASTQDLVTASALTEAANLTLNIGNPANAYPDTIVTANVTNANAYGTSDAAFTNDAFFSFTLTVGSDPLSFETISLQATRGGTSPAFRGFGLRVIDPANNVIDIAGDVSLTSNRGTFTDFSYDLSAIPSLQNVASGESIRFEMAVMMGSFSSGTRNIDIDNIVVTAIPEPTTYAALFGLAGLLLVLRRRMSARKA